MRVRFTVWLLLLLLILHTALALQVSPAKKEFTLDEGKTDTYTLRIINDESSEREIRVSATGDFAKHVEIAEPAFTLAPGDKRIVIKMHHPPSETLQPGSNEAGILIESSAPSAGQFGSGVNLLHKLILFNPYDGAWVEGELSIDTSTLPTGRVSFNLGLWNRGRQGTSVNGKVAVLTIVGTVLDTVQLGSTRLEGGTSGKLASTWLIPEGIPPGNYVANATIFYDDVQRVKREYTAPFSLGEPTVVITGLPEKFETGGIRKLVVPVELLWNDRVELFAQGTLSTERPLITAKSSTKRLLPGKDDLTLFLDLTALEPGPYTLQTEVYAGDRLAGSLIQPVTLVAPASTFGEEIRSESLTQIFVIIAVISLFLLFLLLIGWARSKER